MNAIRDRAYRISWEHALGHRAVMHRNTVDVVGKAQSKVGHIEDSFGAAMRRIENARTIRSENLRHQLARELIEPGGYRRMSREDALSPHLTNIGFGGRRKLGIAETFFEQRQSEQRSVTLIQVEDGHILISETPEDLDASDSKHDFLAEPVMPVTAIQKVR